MDKWVRKALALRPRDPHIEYACAILTLMGNHPSHSEFEGHFVRAANGVNGDELLKANFRILKKRAPAVLRYFKNKKD